MNQKAYSVLFCALLASTFVHELRAKGVAPVSSRKLGVFGSRASISNQQCQLQCTLPNITASFGITIEVVENILVVANISAEAAFLLDASAQIVVLLNGTTGAGVAIDLQAKTGVYISTGLWIGGSAQLEALITGTLGGSLKALLTFAGAVTFNVTTVSSAILAAINGVMVCLVIEIAVEIQRSAAFGLALLLSISAGLVAVLTVEAGLLALIASAGVIAVVYDLAGVLVALKAIVSVISACGGLSALVALGVSLNLALILGATNGIIALSNLLLQLYVSVQALTAVSVILNNSTSLLVLISGLSGGLLVGVSGALVIAAQIALLVNGTVTLDVVLSELVTFVVNSAAHVQANLSSSLNVSIGGLVTVVNQISGSANLTGLVSFANNLQAGLLVIGGISISAILQLLVGVYAGASGLLNVVVAVALKLTIAVQAVILATLFLVLVAKLAVGVGILQLKALGIALSVSVVAAFTAIIAGALVLIPALLLGVLLNALIALPVIGLIATALNSAVTAAGLSLTTIFSTPNAKTLVLGFFQSVTKISLGQNSSSAASALQIFNQTSSVGGYVSGGASLSISSSASGSVSISG